MACASLALGGCEGEEGAGGGDVQPVVKTVKRGPVEMTVTADKNRVTIAEPLGLTIDVFAEAGVDVEMDEPADRLSEFRIRGFSNQPAQAAEGGRKWTRTYELDIFVSGSYTIPEFEARFADRRDEPSDRPGEGVKEGTIRSEPFTIEVTSLREGEFNPERFRDIKGTVELPVERSRRLLVWTAVGAVTGIAGLALLGLWWRRRKRALLKRAVVAPHEWAFDQLRLLIDDRLVEQGQVHEFYFRLSHIVRVYIELRFGLMAPERTTEEFLVEVHRSDLLRAEHQRLLGEFLESCDRVKFAMYEPTAAEVESAFDSAREFVEQTIPRSVGSEAGAAQQAA